MNIETKKKIFQEILGNYYVKMTESKLGNFLYALSQKMSPFFNFLAIMNFQSFFFLYSLLFFIMHKMAYY